MKKNNKINKMKVLKDVPKMVIFDYNGEMFTNFGLYLSTKKIAARKCSNGFFDMLNPEILVKTL